MAVPCLQINSYEEPTRLTLHVRATKYVRDERPICVGSQGKLSNARYPTAQGTGNGTNRVCAVSNRRTQMPCPLSAADANTLALSWLWKRSNGLLCQLNGEAATSLLMLTPRSGFPDLQEAHA